MRGSKGFEIGRPATIGVCLCVMVVLLFVAGGCGEQLTRMEENQIKLQAMVAANAREIATLSSQVHNGTGKLTEGIQTLNAQGQALAANVQTVQDDQRRLQETVVAGNQSLDTKVSSLQESQQSLHNRVAQVQDVTGRTASDLTTLAQQHTALHETVQANQRELNQHVGVVVSNQQGIQASVTSVAGKQDALSATVQDNHRQATERLSALAAGHDKLSTDLLTVNALVQAGNQSLSDNFVILERNQQNHQAGIDRVNSAVNETATMIAAIASVQAAMQNSLVANHEQVTGRLTSIAGSQQNLQTSIDTLHGKADQAAADSATAVSSLQETMRISRDVVTGQMAASLQNQQAIQTSVHELNGKADGLAANIAAVSVEQTATREASKANHEAVITAMAGLSEGQLALRTGVDQINGKADQIHGQLATVTAEQKTQHETAQNNHEAVVARFEGLSKGHADLQVGVNVLNGKADAMNAELTAAAQRQNAMQQSLAVVNEALASQATTAAQNQQSLNAGIGDLSTRAQQLSGDLAAVAAAQNGFRQMQQSHNEAIDVRTAELADGQRSLRTQMDTLTATAGQTALSVLTLNNGQATFQQTMQAGMNGLSERAGRIAEQQTALHQSVQAGNETLAARTTAIAESQQSLQTDVARTAKVVDRAYADLTAVAITQETLQTTVAGRSDEIDSHMARIEDNQKMHGDSLDVLTATAGQTALDLLQLTDNHAGLHRSVKAGNEAVIAQTTALGGQLDVLTATAAQTAIDVLALDNKQSKLTKTVQNGLVDLGKRTDLVANNQQQMQDGMEVLTTMGGQTALDVIGVSDRQAALQRAIQNQNESAETRMAKLAENQQKMQTGLAAVTTTTGQSARDLVALNEAQAKSEQVARASRAELAEKLTAMTQDQQSWLQRFDVAQARIQAMAEGITAIDQQLAKLQGSLQAGVQNTTNLLDANGKQRQQFEAKVAQDVQTMIDAIAQLRQTQALLQEQMSQVQKNTQNQADTLKATIEQIKQPPVEAKVSDAKTVEAPVVETGE